MVIAPRVQIVLRGEPGPDLPPRCFPANDSAAEWRFSERSHTGNARPTQRLRAQRSDAQVEMRIALIWLRECAEPGEELPRIDPLGPDSVGARWGVHAL